MRKYLSYSNIVATLALLFAMSGSALAAKHYLLNSVSQINPHVLVSLRRSAEPDMRYAVVSSEGQVVQSSPNVTAAARHVTAAAPPTDGWLYFVNFHRKINGCATVASETNVPGRWPGGYIPESARGAAEAWIDQGGNGGGEMYPGLGPGFLPLETAEVVTYGKMGANEKSAFAVILEC